MSLFGGLNNDDRLTARAKHVYKNLKDRADKDGKCFPSLKRIASDCSLSKRTVQRAVDDLIKYGYIEKQKRVRWDFSDTSNYYILKK